MRNIPGTDLDVLPLCLGGNVFGWTADERESFAVLDAYAAAGGNFIDTADVYSHWVPGQPRGRVGGDHRPLDGRARQPRRDRDRDEGRLKRRAARASRPTTIRRAAEESLRAPRHRPHRPLLRAPDDPRRRSRRRSAPSTSSCARARSATSRPRTIAAPRLAEALEPARARDSCATSRCSRTTTSWSRDYEGELADVCGADDLGLPAVLRAGQGFLTGKYRPGADGVESPRAQGAARLPRRARRARARRARRGRRRARRPRRRRRARLAARPPDGRRPDRQRPHAGQLAELLPMTDLALRTTRQARSTPPTSVSGRSGRSRPRRGRRPRAGRGPRGRFPRGRAGARG